VKKELTLRQKILACYPHVYTKCIHKLLGVRKQYIYQAIRLEGLPILRHIPYKDKMPSLKKELKERELAYKNSKWANI